MICIKCVYAYEIVIRNTGTVIEHDMDTTFLPLSSLPPPLPLLLLLSPTVSKTQKDAECPSTYIFYTNHVDMVLRMMRFLKYNITPI